MTKIKLMDLLQFIVDEIYTDEIDKDYFKDYMVKNIILLGINNEEYMPRIENEHLINGISTGEEMIKGDFLLFDYCGHSGDMRILEYDNLEAIEKDILSGGGYVNMFCTDMVAIVYGQVKHFDIYFKNNIGKKDCVMKFIKGNHDSKFELDDMKDNWVKWLD